VSLQGPAGDQSTNFNANRDIVEVVREIATLTEAPVEARV
jgi:hypothetical protein